jgi:hypothetical protein
MQRRVRKLVRSGRSLGVFKKTLLIFGAILLLCRDSLREDVAQIWEHARLFVGTAFVVVGLLSFSSDRYCDGNTSSYYACTRPSTYYEYPWWAILLTVLGSVLIVLWFLRRKN